ncbi:MAG: cyclase family protein [Clostridia bacterium]|nr:cyclase family protein [Clostridia bacterium]
MKIIDISQEVFSCSVFPGDEEPQRVILDTIEDGSICNLTGLKMCAHNGTHVDAPYHFYNDGKTIDELSLDALVGKCYVTFAQGPVTAETMTAILNKAKAIDEEAARRILIGGDMYVTLEAAQVLASENVLLIGNESQTVGPLNAPAAVHYELLKKEVVLLEGIRLNDVSEGVYLLNAAPLNLGASDGAPCRAILIRNQ